MAITSKNQRLITYKKLLGKSHTSAQKGITGEADPSSVQLGSSFIFGEEVNNDTIKLVEFTLIPADLASYEVDDDLDEGQDGDLQGLKNHAWKLVLPSDYSEDVEPAKFQAGNVVSENNKLQIVPDTYGTQYKPRVYADDLMTDEILNTDREDWILDPFSGVLFFQDVFDKTPVRVQAYIYMGKYLDEALMDAASSGGDSYWNINPDDPDIVEASKFVAINMADTYSNIDLLFQKNYLEKASLRYKAEQQTDVNQDAFILSPHDRFDIGVGGNLEPTVIIKNNLEIEVSFVGTLGPISTFEIPKSFGLDRSMLIVNKPKPTDSTNNNKWNVQGEAAVGQFWNSWTTSTAFGGPTVGLFSLSGPKEDTFLFPSLGLYGSRGDETSASPIQANDVIGRILAYGNSQSGLANFSWKPAAWIEFVAAENFTSTDGAATIRFCTTDNAANTTGNNVKERFTVSHNGNVVSRSSFYALSQGTNNTSNIHIRKDATVDGSNLDFVLSHRSSGKELWLYSSDSNNDFANFVSFKHEGSTTKKITFPADGNLFEIDLLAGKTTTNGSSYIKPTTGKAALYLERVPNNPTIKSLDGYLIMDSAGSAAALNYFAPDDVLLARGGGNVGIGTNNPSEKLQVEGNLSLRRNLVIALEGSSAGSIYFHENNNLTAEIEAEKDKDYDIYDPESGTVTGTSPNNGRIFFRVRQNGSLVDLVEINRDGLDLKQGVMKAFSFSGDFYGDLIGKATSANLADYVTNGVYTNTNQDISGQKTFTNTMTVFRSENQAASSNLGTGIVIEENGLTDTWNIGVRAHSETNPSRRLNFNFASDFYDGNPSWTTKGYLLQGSDVGQITFTGQHRNKSLDTKLYDNLSVGLIVISSGTYSNIDGHNNITLNESLPIVALSSKRNQKNVWGVISDKEDFAVGREHAAGSFVSVYNISKEDTRLIINSLGEGGIWVTNVNGNLENGDYITTCEIPGYGMKQDDDLLHNYTVAKITCDCDFNLESPIYICEEFQWEGNTYRRAFVGCTYHCG
jgi:hypothetical protein